jgi:hypothetical protein
MAPSVSAGFKVTHTPYSKLAVSLKSAQQSIPSKRAPAGGLKKRFFQARNEKRPRKQRFPGTPGLFVTKMNGFQPQIRTLRTRQP